MAAIEVNMRLRNFVVFGLLVISLASYGSQLSDLKSFKKILEENHPGLYEYTSKEEFTKYYSVAEEVIKQQPDNIHLFTRTLASLIEKIGCGHTRIEASDSFTQDLLSYPYFFPLAVEVWQGALYVYDENASKVLRVKTINNESSETILDSVYDLASSDARSLALKNHLISSRFFTYLYLSGLSAENYVVEWVDNKGIVGKTVYKGERIQKVAQTNGSRQQLKYGLENGNQYQLKHYQDFSLLSVRSFAFQGEAEKLFKSFLSQAFESLKKKNVKRLIIDVMGNGGGSRALSVELFSYLTTHSFEQRQITRIKGLKPSFNNLVKPNEQYYDKVMELLSNRYSKQLEQSKDHLSKNMKPQANPYKGEVVVLVDNGTYSAGAEFALLAKENPKIIVAGMETGGNCMQHNGDLTLTYELPVTKTKMEIPYVHIKHAQSLCSNNKDGIMPDIQIETSPFNTDFFSESKLKVLLSKTLP
ncbi:S41 family peptidase [Pleionea sediminis]|uniref:S41 family peptidase n=1 Tax=Pleionea sediminis TaxID=2569479 RepID=UPI001186D6EF|nr:S41 family peptidase [Pleionea sediminis]